MLASLTYYSSAGLLLLLQRPDSGSINSGTATVGDPRSGPAETNVGRSLSEGDDCYTGRGADYRGTAAVVLIIAYIKLVSDFKKMGEKLDLWAPAVRL